MVKGKMINGLNQIRMFWCSNSLSRNIGFKFHRIYLIRLRGLIIIINEFNL